MSGRNNELATNLMKLASYYEGIKERFRAQAYRSASLHIRKHETPITSGKQARLEVYRIGESISKKIDEFLETGAIALLEKLPVKPKESKVVDKDPWNQPAKTKTQIVKMFQGIHGIGKVTAEKWYADGHRTFEDVADVKKTAAQTLGYKYYYDLQERIPRDEMDLIAKQIEGIFSLLSCDHPALDGPIEHLICGSYRRKAETSGDVDCLIRGQPNLKLTELVDALTKAGLLIGHLTSKGKSKFMGILKLNGFSSKARRIDLLIVDPPSWPFATLYFTGSQKLNILMRNRAIEQGLSLNEYGLSDSSNSKMVEGLETEQDIFGFIGMPYLTPVERNID